MIKVNISNIETNLVPGDAVVENLPASESDTRDTGSIPGQEDPLEKKMATHSGILAWRIPMDRRAWQATVHGVTKSQTQLRDQAQHSIHILFIHKNFLLIFMFSLSILK